MSAVTFVTRMYTPLAFRETTERWLEAALAAIVAVVWVFVIPLELVLHDPSTGPVAAHTAEPAGPTAEPEAAGAPMNVGAADRPIRLTLPCS